MHRFSIYLALAVVLLGGCARVAAISGSTTSEKPTSGTGERLPDSNIRASGFLGHYDALKPLPGKANTWRYVKPGVDWKRYDKVMIEPMEVWINPEADRPGIQPEVFSEIDKSFREIVAKEFREGGYQVVQRPGPGVLVFHVALTGVTPVHQGIEATDLLPIKAAINAGKYAFGAEPYYIVLSGEFEVIDSISGERLFASVGARRGYETKTKGSQLSWSEVKDTFTWLAKQWREGLDRARGVTS